MHNTLNELVEDNDIDAPTADKLLNFIKYTTYFLVACSEVTMKTLESKTFDFPLSDKYTDIGRVSRGISAATVLTVGRKPSVEDGGLGLLEDSSASTTVAASVQATAPLPAELK